MQASALRAQVLERCRRTLRHDINNAVQSIHSGLELIGKCLAAPDQIRVSPQECLALLQQQFVTLRKTLDRLVDEVAEPAGPPESFDIAALTADAVHLLRHERAAARAKTTIAEGVIAHASKVNIRTIILAVLLDAIDHLAADGALEVDVSQGEQQAVIEIRSTRAITDAAQTSTRALVELVKRLLAEEGGELNVRTMNEGISTSLYIPSPARRSANEDRAAQPPRVLIADRNRDAADSLAMVLQLQGMQTEAVYSGTALSEAIDRFSPDVALIDIDLPGCDVVALASSLRERGGSRTLLAQVFELRARETPGIRRALLTARRVAAAASVGCARERVGLAHHSRCHLI